MPHICNALTGFIYTDKFTGTLDEHEFYRVMPLGSTQKLFFEGIDEYLEWRCREYVESRTDLTDKQILDMSNSPLDSPPVPIRTDFLSCYSAISKSF